MGQESLQIMGSQHPPQSRAGTVWKQMETITGQNWYAAGMGVVILNFREPLDTQGQKGPPNVKVCRL